MHAGVHVCMNAHVHVCMYVYYTIIVSISVPPSTQCRADIEKASGKKFKVYNAQDYQYHNDYGTTYKIIVSKTYI